MDHDDHPPPQKKIGKLHNTLPLWGNEATMNLNPLILANIQSSSYFKVHLFKLKTYHEVVDEIYYQVKHLEPWERGSRKTAGQTGMCGGVRGVGAGGIVSTAYCLLYKLYTLRLTRKQVNGLLTHTDSPYIRALGFMYIRYTQPPADLYDWYEDYLQDEEEIDVKAGGGQTITIGQMLHQWLVKLDWFSTLFPRIPVPIQKQIETKLAAYAQQNNINFEKTTYSSNTERDYSSYGPSNKHSSGGTSNSSGSRERFDRGRDKDRHYYKTDDRRQYRSRSKERTYDRGSDYKEYRHQDRNNDREYYHREKRDNKEYYRSNESNRNRDPDSYGNRDHYNSSSSRHRDHDKKYR